MAAKVCAGYKQHTRCTEAAQFRPASRPLAVVVRVQHDEVYVIINQVPIQMIVLHLAVVIRLQHDEGEREHQQPGQDPDHRAAPCPLSSACSTTKVYLSTSSQVRIQMIMDVAPSTASRDGRGAPSTP